MRIEVVRVGGSDAQRLVIEPRAPMAASGWKAALGIGARHVAEVAGTDAFGLWEAT